MNEWTRNENHWLQMDVVSEAEDYISERILGFNLPVSVETQWDLIEGFRAFWIASKLLSTSRRMSNEVGGVDSVILMPRQPLQDEISVVIVNKDLPEGQRWLGTLYLNVTHGPHISFEDNSWEMH